jgi:hypothetical protein
LKGRQQLEQAETYVPALNAQLEQLGVIDLANDITLLGGVIHERPYAAGSGRDDSAQFSQAVLLAPEGIGAAVWDMEEYVENQKSPSGNEEQARLKFVPFDECSSAVKALLLPQVRPLLERLFALIGQKQD